MESKGFVYVLYRNVVVEYIGVTIDPEQRFKKHFYEAFNENGKEYRLRKSRWIRKYKDEVKMKVVFSGPLHECYQKEIELILLAKSKGRIINNLTDGGDKPPKINSLPNFEEIKEKIRAKAIGRVISDETRKRMSDSQKATAHLRIRKKSMVGANNPNAKPVVQLTPEGEVIREWDYAQQAIRTLGLHYTAITNCIKGLQKTAGGYKWAYKENGKTKYKEI